MSIRILVVDDASFIRDMIKKNLREKVSGAEVFDAVDGNRAIALMKTQKIDLILSDWEMPGMSGEEFLQWVRNSEQYANVPFVMVSSRGDRDHVVKAVQAGVSDYLTKPFTPEELMKKTFKQLKKIGKAPGAGQQTRQGSTQGMAFASVGVLTGTAGAETGNKAPQAATKKSADSSSQAAPAAKTKGKAQLRFPRTTSACVIREISLQALSGLIQRSDDLPTVFDQAVVDIEMDSDGSVARVNGYVHSIQAAEQKVDSNIIKIVIRFVDNDPEKFEILSKYIAQV